MSALRIDLYKKSTVDYEGGIKLAKAFPPDVVDRIKTFPLETGDVVIATYAKAGRFETLLIWFRPSPLELLFLLCFFSQYLIRDLFPSTHIKLTNIPIERDDMDAGNDVTGLPTGWRWGRQR